MDMFEIHQLRCFVAIAEELHFGHAAERLHMTQPPLSRQLRLLEEALDVRLVDRNSRTVRLTVAGAAFLEHARGVLRLAADGRRVARLAAQGEVGHVSLGFTVAAAFELLPALLRDFRSVNPGVSLQLKEMVSSAQLAQLEQGLLDACLARPIPAAQGYAQLTMARDTLVAALPAAHPLAQREALDIAAFDREPFIDHDPDDARYYHDLVWRSFSTHGVAPEVTQSVSQPHTMISMVRAGLGLALVAGWVQHHTVSRDVVFRPLVWADPPPPLELRLVWRADRMTPALGHFIAIARQLAGLPAGSGDGP